MPQDPNVRARSLALANEVRLTRVRLARLAGTDPRAAEEALLAPPKHCGGMPVRQLLRGLRGVGQYTARGLMLRANLSATRTLGGLTPTERTRLALLLRKRRERRERPRQLRIDTRGADHG